MFDDILEDQVLLYRQNFLEHGDSPRGTFQNSLTTMHLRYERLLEGLDLSKSPTLLDVGCGLGDLHAYLKSNNLEHAYHGSEIVPEMVKACRAKYPEIQVTTDTVFEMPEESFDFVVLSGALNLRYHTAVDQWQEYCLSLIKRMFAICKLGISFNFLTTRNDYQAPELVYFDPPHLLGEALKLSRFVKLNHSYPLFEATITVYKKDWAIQSFPQPELARYLR